MDATLHVLREMAGQREYQALQQTCADFLLLDNHPEVMILQMLALANIGEKDHAASLLAAFDQATDLDSLPPFARLAMGSVCSALARFEEAENWFNGLIEEAFCLGIVLAKKGYCRLMQEDHTGAEALFVEALEHENRPLEVVINLCELHLAKWPQSSSIDRVQAYLSYAELEEDTFLEACSEHQLGLREQLDAIRLECWVKQAQRAEAESWLCEMRDDEPRYAQNVACYAESLMDAGEFVAAEAMLRLGLRSYPHHSLLLHGLEQARSLPLDKMMSHSVINSALSARVRARFHPAFVSSRLSAADDDEAEMPSYALGLDRLAFSPVFLLSLPCSGLSLLEKGFLEEALSEADPCATSIISVAVEGINIAQRALGAARAYPDNLDVLTPRQIQDLVEGIQSAYQARSSSRFMLDTNLDNIHHVGFIKWLFPNAKFVVVNRNVRDWLPSSHLDQWLVSQGLATVEEKADCLAAQFTAFKALEAHWQNCFPTNVLTVTVEQWRQSPTETLDEIARFIGMEDIGMEQNSAPSMSAGEEEALEKRTGIRSKRSMLQLAFNKALLKHKAATPVTDMATLPKAGMLSAAFRLYTENQPREAEYQCKVLLHHLPSFAPAHYLLGELYLANGLIELGIQSLEQAVSLASWKAARWRRNLPQAYQRLTEQKETQ